MIIKVKTTVPGKDGKKHTINIKTTTEDYAYIEDLLQLNLAADILGDTDPLEEEYHKELPPTIFESNRSLFHPYNEWQVLFSLIFIAGVLFSFTLGR